MTSPASGTESPEDSTETEPREDSAEAQGSTEGEGTSGHERAAKVERLRSEGIDPYPQAFPDRTKIATILAEHDPAELGEGEHSKWSYRIAGRLTGRRGHGKTVFFDLRDLSGSMQAYARRDVLDEEDFNRIEDLNIGDIVGVQGDLYVTKRGQLALGVRECTLLAKALRDPPDLFHGVSDVETRYRQRELDLMAGEESREAFKVRAKLVAGLRTYLNEHDFVELETPILQPLAGGAAARPFKTHHNALNRELFLRTATELYLKRGIVGGFENVYELGRFFRNEGLSPEHNPEFTMLEWFLSCVDYKGIMDFAEQMIASAVENALGKTEVERNGETIDFGKPWKRLTLQEAILAETGVDILGTGPEDPKLIAELTELLEGEVSPNADWAGLVDGIQGKLIEPKLTQPTFLTDLPMDLWPTVKPHPEYSHVGEAFDGIVDGLEVIGGGSDTNDPEAQRQNFIRQRVRREAGSADAEAPYPKDDEFVQALEYGMLPASGSGIGIDRLAMILTGSENLRGVILFPTMRGAGPSE